MRKIYLLLIALLFITCKSQPVLVELPIDVIEPEFEVVSIYIIQADLVVTEFEAVIKIENPNNFTIDLESIKYELYGNNLFWADGVAKDVLHIPAKSSEKTQFRFTMNFINTNRKLLDDVIAMRRINYRFKGQAEIKFNVPRAFVSNVKFDCSGLSDVKRKAD
ncbi:LEA/WHy family protein [Treponema sp. R6D11]